MTRLDPNHAPLVSTGSLWSRFSRGELADSPEQTSLHQAEVASPRGPGRSSVSDHLSLRAGGLELSDLENVYIKSKQFQRPSRIEPGSGLFRGVLLLVAPFLLSTTGQTRSMQEAETDIVRLGLKPTLIGESWSRDQKEFFVRVSALALAQTPDQKRPLAVISAIFRRTDSMHSNTGGLDDDLTKKIRTYEDLLANAKTDEVRIYAKGWIAKLNAQVGSGGVSPGDPPRRPTTTESNCPWDWDQAAPINDGRHRLASLRSLYASHGDFMVPITATRIDRETGKRKDVQCEVPVSKLLRLRVSENEELGIRSPKEPLEKPQPRSGEG